MDVKFDITAVEMSLRVFRDRRDYFVDRNSRLCSDINMAVVRVESRFRVEGDSITPPEIGNQV